MRKVIFGLIATVLMVNLSWGQNNMNFNDYGYYHNEALSEFVLKHGQDQTRIDFILDEGLKLMIDKYPNIFSNASLKGVKEFFNVNETKDFNFKNLWNNNKNIILKELKIPAEIYPLMDELINKEYDYETMIMKIQNFEKNEKLTNDGKNLIIVLKSVLISSNDYWNSYYKKNSASLRRHRPGSATLIADFMASGCFLFTGPVAAIAGFAASYITHQSDR
jgi:hypothetical protein